MLVLSCLPLSPARSDPRNASVWGKEVLEMSGYVDWKRKVIQAGVKGCYVEMRKPMRNQAAPVRGLGVDDPLVCLVV